MGQAVALNGDPTSTGGQVIATQSIFCIEGKAAVRKGDLSFCPICKQMGSVAEGSTLTVILDAGVAYTGAKIQCGCPYGRNYILASQARVVTELMGGGGSDGEEDVDSPSPQPAKATGKHSRKFLLQDDTGKPLANTEYLTVINGATLYGTTDNQGYTQNFISDTDRSLEIHTLTKKNNNEASQ